MPAGERHACDISVCGVCVHNKECGERERERGGGEEKGRVKAGVRVNTTHQVPSIRIK